VPSPTTAAIPSILSISISEKLTKSNYQLWRAQVLPAVRGHRKNSSSSPTTTRPPPSKAILLMYPGRPETKRFSIICFPHSHVRHCSMSPGASLRPKHGEPGRSLLANVCSICQQVYCASHHQEELDDCLRLLCQDVPVRGQPCCIWHSSARR
jgi:hypothetical protein